jgi:hypothetical protein
VEILSAVALAAPLLAAAVWGLTREDAKLRRRASRYRQLELEGIEEVRRDDPYPEEVAIQGAYLREPDGRAANAELVLHEELQRAREYTKRRGKGAPCLL